MKSSELKSMPRNWKWHRKNHNGYRSGLEEKVAAYLEAKGIKFQYESLVLTYAKGVRKGLCEQCGSRKVVKIATYTPDFVLDNGIIIEVKGRLTSTDRTKLLAVMRSNPERKLRLYFGSDNKLQKTSDKRYSDWAKQHKFDFAIGTIPRRWLSRQQPKDPVRDGKDPS
jgi:hypothetical protein